ncbi:MAG: hypothetical protein ABII22_07200 [Candidatus Micrarchaeota archaeon]
MGQSRKGRKSRGRERLESCEGCGRSFPRHRGVEYSKKSFFSTDLRTGDNVTQSIVVDAWYCLGCAKHRGILEKIKRQNERKRGVF